LSKIIATASAVDAGEAVAALCLAAGEATDCAAEALFLAICETVVSFLPTAGLDVKVYIGFVLQRTFPLPWLKFPRSQQLVETPDPLNLHILTTA
jgi:hypothetical protein